MRELCYANNPKSLFRKYARLVTWFANTNTGRDYLNIPQRFNDIGLLVPNGFHRVNGNDAEARFYTNQLYSKKLAPVLTKIDLVNNWIKNFNEAKHFLIWELGLTRRKPAFAPLVMFADFIMPDAAGAGYCNHDHAVFATVHDAAASNNSNTGSPVYRLQSILTGGTGSSGQSAWFSTPLPSQQT